MAQGPDNPTGSESRTITQATFLEGITGFKIFSALPRHRENKYDPYAGALATLEASATGSQKQEEIVVSGRQVIVTVKEIQVSKPLPYEDVEITVVHAHNLAATPPTELVGVFGQLYYGEELKMSKALLVKNGDEPISVEGEYTRMGHSSVLRLTPAQYLETVLKAQPTNIEVTRYILKGLQGDDTLPEPGSMGTTRTRRGNPGGA